MTIKTSQNKTFNCDLAVTSPNPPRLYLHIVDADIADVAKVFTDKTELPIEGYPSYTEFDSMNMTQGGINICLK